MPQHSYVPFGVSLGGSSFDECIRPSLRYAYPLPQDHADDLRFRRLLAALARRYGATKREGNPAS